MQPQYTPSAPNISPPESPCPQCGHGAYTQRKSDLLDTIVLVQDMLADLKKLVEEVVV